MFNGEGWAVSEGSEIPLQLEPLRETIETSLRARIARKQRSETCVLVARELIALGQWYEMETPHPPNEVSGGIQDADNRPVSTAANVGGSRTKRAMKESSRAEWLRNVCRETLDKWGKELLD